MKTEKRKLYVLKFVHLLLNERKLVARNIFEKLSNNQGKIRLSYDF